ncbi:MAG: PAS domain-containing sensor histidine kinase [Deltaproteobacteria bacterium]|nr:PAS domain-containing sensor histidine kinase [Deltaproteobacteria bacterium]
MEQLYKKYFQDMPCYLTVQDRNLKVIDANRRFKDDFGNWTGRHCYQIYKNRSEICEVCPVEETFRDGQCHSSESQVVSLDGKETSVIVYTTPIRDDTGEIISVMKMSADITGVKRLQSQFRDSKKRYQQLFDEVPCYISIQDHDLNIVEANRRFTKDFGASLGCKCYETYKHRKEECIPCPVQQTFEDGQVHSSDEIVTSREGEQMNVLVYTSPIFDSMGMIKGVMEMGTDITPIRELQSQLESMGILISSISHGIKGLLNGLDGGMYLVDTGMKKGDDERLKKGWEMVKRNVERVRSQVLNILYYTKKRTPKWERISAVELAEELLSLMGAKATELDVDLESAVDEGAGDFEADPQAMRSMFLNLLENSLDACRVDKDKSNHRVTFGVKGDDDHVRFEIEDNGIGMDRETREKAFSLFFSSKGAKGTGLGLFIANKITKSHGGNIELDSELGRGSRFTLLIPRKKKPTESEDSEQ